MGACACLAVRFCLFVRSFGCPTVGAFVCVCLFVCLFVCFCVFLVVRLRGCLIGYSCVCVLVRLVAGLSAYVFVCRFQWFCLFLFVSFCSCVHVFGSVFGVCLFVDCSSVCPSVCVFILV